MKLRKRPAIWIAEAFLGTALVLSVWNNLPEYANPLIVAIAATLHKLVESEEKGEPQD